MSRCNPARILDVNLDKNDNGGLMVRPDRDQHMLQLKL